MRTNVSTPLLRSHAVRKLLTRTITFACIAALYLFLPLLPLLASIAFLRKDYLLRYGAMLKRFLIHIPAMRDGPVEDYFGSVFGLTDEAPVQIKGSCVQCGNCCMDRRCVFLETLDESRYQCGIYHSPLRRFSNCGSYPLNQRDIDRYACPSYFAVETVPVRFVSEPGELRPAG